MSNEIKAAFDTAFRAYRIDGVKASGEHKPDKSEIRAIGPVIDDRIDTESEARVSAVSALASEVAAVKTIAQAGIKADLPVVKVLLTTDTAASSMTNGATLDGVTVATGDYVAKAYNGLTGHSSNGIYQVQSAGSATRASFFDSSDEILRGRFTVEDGTHAGETWSVQNTSAINVGSTAIVIAMTTPANAQSAEVISGRLGADSLAERNALLRASAGKLNGWYDPFFRDIVLSPTKHTYGRLRWSQGDTEWEFVDNPIFAGRALRRDGTGSSADFIAGPIIYIDELGAEVGDTITIRGLFVGDGPLVNFAARPQASNLTAIDSQKNGETDSGGATLTTSSTPGRMTIEFTIPSNTVAVRVYAYTSNMNLGSRFDWIALWAGKGDASTVPDWPNIGDPDVEYAARRVRGYRPKSVNEHAFPNMAAKIMNGEAVTIGLFGDSWTNVTNRYIDELESRIAATWGVSGPGYVSANSELNARTGLGRSRSGTWTDERVTGGLGPDGAHASTTDDDASYTFTPTVPITLWRVHYAKQSGGGSFTCTVGAGSPENVATDGVEESDYVELVGNGTDALQIDITSADSGVILLGVEGLNTTAGEFVLHKLGNGGADAKRFADIDEDHFIPTIAAMELDVAFILLGINDASYSINQAAYRTYLETVADRIITACPGCDIGLIGPGPLALVKFNSSSYNDEMFKLASDRRWAFLDLFPLYGPDYALAQTRGMYMDAYHPSALGGSLNGRFIYNTFFKHFE